MTIEQRSTSEHTGHDAILKILLEQRKKMVENEGSHVESVSSGPGGQLARSSLASGLSAFPPPKSSNETHSQSLEYEQPAQVRRPVPIMHAYTVVCKE